MTSRIENLIARRTQLIADLQAETVEWVAKALRNEIAELDLVIARNA